MYELLVILMIFFPPGTSVSEVHSMDPLSSSDPTGLAKMGKRKRKVPAALEDSPTPIPGGGWSRACLGYGWPLHC